jgi:carboxypeptidase family protein
VAKGRYTVGGRMPMPFQKKGTSETIEVDGVKDITDLVITVEDKKSAVANRGKGGGSIEGVVLKSDGSPAAKAQVTGKMAGMPAFPGMSKSTSTGTDGAFTLTGLMGETFDLSATGDGAIGEAAGVKSGDKVTIRLAPAGSISGMVVAKDGAAVESCKVTLKNQAEDEENPMAAMFGGMLGKSGGKETDLNGFFLFENVKPGDFVIKALSKTKGSASSNMIKVAAGAEVKGLRIQLVPGVAVAGTVVNRAGQAVSGASLTLIEGGQGGMAEMMSGLLPAGMAANSGTGTSGSDGAWRIENVPIGTYTIAASHGDYAPVKAPGLQLQAGRDATGQRLVLPDPASISGTLVVDGEVRANVMIQFIGENGMRMTTTDSEGSFNLDGLASGSYLMNTVNMGAAMSGNLADAMVSSPRIVEIGEGEHVEYDPTPLPGSQPVGGLISGEGLGNMTIVTLRRPGGPAPEDLDPMNPMSSLNAMRYQAGQAAVGEDGSFTMPDVPPGDYILEVQSFNFDMENPDIAGMMNMDRTPIHRQELTVGEGPVTANIDIHGAAARE